MQAETPGERCDEGRGGTRRPAGVVGRVLRDQRTPDNRAADVAERLRREQLAARLDDGERRALIAAVEREAGEDLPAQVRGADAVPREPEPMVDPAATPEDRQGGRRGGARPPP